MSRIGQSPIPIPSGVDIAVTGNLVQVKGARGQLERRLPEGIAVEQGDGELRVTRAGEERELKALHGLFRSLLANMVQGVTDGFEKGLEIQGVGYRATKKGDDLELAVGFSDPVTKTAPPGIEFEVPSPTCVVVRDIYKELVGQIATEISAIRKPEPYMGKGIRYAGDHVRLKAGKAAKAAG